MAASLRYGPPSAATAHLCVDMQNLFAEDTPWRTPWMTRVRPIVAELARYSAPMTIFTRFIPPEDPGEAPGIWQRYFAHWRELTRQCVDPHLLELVPELRELVPSAKQLDKQVYSPFHDGRLAHHLRRRGIDTLVISGAETDLCVLTAVLAAVDHGYRVILAVDALCSSSDESHDGLMQLYSNRFSHQIEMATTETILRTWPNIL